MNSEIILIYKLFKFKQNKLTLKNDGCHFMLIKFEYSGILSYNFNSLCNHRHVGGLSSSLIAAPLARVQRLACCMVTSAFLGTPTSVMEALLSFPPLPLYLRGQALLVKHHLQRSGRWDEVGIGGRIVLTVMSGNCAMQAYTSQS